MKPLFIILTAISSFFANNSQAADGVSPTAQRSFALTFTHAREVRWTETAGLYKVSFLLNRQYAMAYYNEAAELVAITRNISSQQLPELLQADLKKKYATQWISELFEVSDQSGTYYYVTMEDADTKTTLKAEGPSRWSVYKKVRK